MKKKVFLGQHSYTWLQGDDKKLNLLKEALKNKKVVLVDETSEFDSIKRFFPKDVAIVKSKSEADKLIKND